MSGSYEPWNEALLVVDTATYVGDPAEEITERIEALKRGAFPVGCCRIAWAMARDLLTAGHSVVANSVNPISITRAGWETCARDTGSPLLNVEVVCANTITYRRRVEQRTSDLVGLTVPTWTQVEERFYEPWDDQVVKIDTALGVEGPAEEIAVRIKTLTR